MEKQSIKQQITKTVILTLARETKELYVPVAVSARHVHLSLTDLETLFGKGYQLKKLKDLSQPGQYAAEETINIIGPKGGIQGVRILGPVRGTTQVELAASDCRKLGVTPTLRMSGDIENTPGILIEGPAGKLQLNQGVIVAKNHIHISKQQAAIMNLRDKQHVDAELTRGRKIIFMDVEVRVNEQFDLEMHIDTDEANAGMINGNELLRIRSCKND